MEDTARQHYVIGDNLRHKGFYEDALEEFEKALNIRESLLEEYDIDLATTNYSIGLTKKALKDYPAAFLYLQKALHIFEELQAQEQQQAAQLQAKAQNDEDQDDDDDDGDDNEVGPTKKKTTTTSTTAPTTPLTTTISNWILQTKLNLARTHHSQGLDYQLLSDFDQSIHEHRKALGYRELYLGVDHLETARTYYVLGCALSDKGLYDESLCELRRALRTRFVVFGKDHLDTIEVVENMITVLHAKGSYGRFAILDYKESLLKSIAYEVQGDVLLRQCNGRYVSTEHPEIATWAETAMVHFRKALSLEEQCLGELGPTTCDLHLKVAKSLGLLNCLDESLDEYKASICVFERLLGKFHYTMGQIYMDLADILSERDEYETSLCFYCKAYGILDSTVGNHDDTKVALRKVRVAAALYEQARRDTSKEEDGDEEDEFEYYVEGGVGYDNDDGDDGEEEEEEEKEETVEDTSKEEVPEEEKGKETTTPKEKSNTEEEVTVTDTPNESDEPQPPATTDTTKDEETVKDPPNTETEDNEKEVVPVVTGPGGTAAAPPAGGYVVDWN
jgi:tetratricopeptide (TPR) repeat protein